MFTLDPPLSLVTACFEYTNPSQEGGSQTTQHSLLVHLRNDYIPSASCKGHNQTFTMQLLKLHILQNLSDISLPTLPAASHITLGTSAN